MTMKSLMHTAGAIACLSMSSAALACSICRCGDPTFNALGKEGVPQTGLRLALDWDQVEKTQGPPEEQDALREQRETLLLAYGLSDRFDLFARLPHSQRTLTETEDGEAERSSSSGLADPEIYAQARLWSSRFEGDVGMRSNLYFVFGVKTDWGVNDASEDGERLDEHAQPGTGSTDWFAGLSGSYQINPRSAIFASAQFRQTGRNDFGYQYGDVQLLNLAYEHKLGGHWDAVLEANYRHSAGDEIDALGEQDPDTGGSIVYLTPRLLFDAGHGWVLRAAVQVPLSQAGLNGEQHEKTVFNIGVTYLFKWIRPGQQERSARSEADRDETLIGEKQRAPGRETWAPISLLPALARSAASNQVHDAQQDDRTQQRHQQRRHAEVALVDGRDPEDRAQQPSTQQRARDADHHVEQYSLLSVGAHDEAGNPADDSTNGEPDDDVH
jgi:hypothetical protein